MTAATHSAPVSAGLLWTGWIVTAFVILFLVFDGVTKVVKVTPVMEASAKLGLGESAVAPIGVILLVCTVVYAVPPTAVLGAILLTGYLGGAIAIHARASSGAFPIAFSIAFAVLAWLGLVLREPKILWMVFGRN